MKKILNKFWTEKSLKFFEKGLISLGNKVQLINPLKNVFLKYSKQDVCYEIMDLLIINKF